MVDQINKVVGQKNKVAGQKNKGPALIRASISAGASSAMCTFFMATARMAAASEIGEQDTRDSLDPLSLR